MAPLDFPGGKTLQKLSRLLAAPMVEPSQRAARIQTVERDIVLPIKSIIIVIVLCFLFFSNWNDAKGSVRQQALDWIRIFFGAYALANIAVGIVLVRCKQLPLRVLEWLVFGVGLLDGALMAALTFMSTGYDSLVYWVFLALILHNALAIPLATPQIALNALVCSCYIFGGMADRAVSLADFTADAFADNVRAYVRRDGSPHKSTQENPLLKTNAPTGDRSHLATRIVSSNSLSADLETLDKGVIADLMAGARAKALEKYAGDHIENPVERLIVLVLWAACCYGIQILFEKQKRAEAEATELAVRQERLHTAGRMAAEIAHQIKNPLGIISNAAFCLERAAKQGQRAATEQVEIIREEIERADRIITELMGYAQLAEGKVEKLVVAEELDQAIQEVFPAAAKYEVEVRRNFAPQLPGLLMQRRHLNGVLVNLMQNAREAMNGKGKMEITAHYGGNDSIEIIIADNGPGIPPDKLDKIFEAYFTTRAKGTGIGLAIVKHNTEIYGGTVRVESELGKGTRFILQFPPRILMRIT